MNTINSIFAKMQQIDPALILRDAPEGHLWFTHSDVDIRGTIEILDNGHVQVYVDGRKPASLILSLGFPNDEIAKRLVSMLQLKGTIPRG